MDERDLADGLIIPMDRHPSIKHFAPLFAYGHLTGERRNTSALMAVVAQRMVDRLQDNPELAAGLRKLLEAKDCLVRVSVR